MKLFSIHTTFNAFKEKFFLLLRSNAIEFLPPSERPSRRIFSPGSSERQARKPSIFRAGKSQEACAREQRRLLARVRADFVGCNRTPVREVSISIGYANQAIPFCLPTATSLALKGAPTPLQAAFLVIWPL
jgi:hypothetical protein